MFLLYMTGTVAFGIVLSLLVEQPSLKLRDRLFPSRGAVVVDGKA
jgi:peptidoglycan/LPS O-acetylase OafA/YrhL